MGLVDVILEIKITRMLEQLSQIRNASKILKKFNKNDSSIAIDHHH